MDDVAIKVLALQFEAIMRQPREPVDPKIIELANRINRALPPSPPRVRNAGDLGVVDELSETMERMGKKMSPWLRSAILNLFEKERELVAMGLELD